MSALDRKRTFGGGPYRTSKSLWTPSNNVTGRSVEQRDWPVPCSACRTSQAETMAQAHDGQAAHSHMHDFEGHVEAVEADLEYWRAKRLEPRLIQLHRRSLLTFYDLMRAATAHPAASMTAVAYDTEARIRALEDGLDDYIRGINL